MKEADQRRTTVISGLLSLDLSTQKELEDIISLASVVCQSEIAVLTLLKDNKQYIEYSIGYEENILPSSKSFCRHMIMEDDILEIADAMKDNRFFNPEMATDDTCVRFCAGSPMTTKAGDKIGSLCVLDKAPKRLNKKQREMLRILSKQAVSILELELSVGLLKEKIAKIQESEMKLRAILQSSHSCHLLVDKQMKVMACNKATGNTMRLLMGSEVREGILFTSLLTKNIAKLFTMGFACALMGHSTSADHGFDTKKQGTLWWAVDFNPAYDHKGDIIGVSIDATNITEKINDKQNILNQYEALRKIAQIQSHEIRHPVANIIAITELLNESDENFRLNLQLLHSEVKNLDIKIHKIVELSNQANVVNRNLYTRYDRAIQKGAFNR